jgi:hypothetical protein
MVIYKCPRCHHTASQKSNIRAHYNRKIPCIIKYTDISIEECIEELKKNINHKCEYCNKCFKRKSHLTHHIGICKIRNKGLLEENNKLKEKIKNLENTHSTITNNTHNINSNNTNHITNHNNVIVIKFDVNNLSTRIPDAEKLKCFRDKTYQAPPIEDFLKTIHFNPEYPEYHNIFKTDMNREWISMFDGTRIVKQPENFVDDIIGKIEKEIEYLIDNNEEYKEYYRGLQTHLNMMKKDEEYRESLVKGVKLLIHNNKDVPSGTLKLLGVM